MRGYSYDRRDVTGRGLANAYAQTLGSIFSSGGEKPYEVEIFVGEVGDTADGDQVYRLTYDGQVADEQGFAAMGGSAEQVTEHLQEPYRPGLSLEEALAVTIEALGTSESGSRVIPVESLEVAVLDRTRTQQRKFKRLRSRAAAARVARARATETAAAGVRTRHDAHRAPARTSLAPPPDDEPPIAPPLD